MFLSSHFRSLESLFHWHGLLKIRERDTTNLQSSPLCSLLFDTLFCEISLPWFAPDSQLQLSGSVSTWVSSACTHSPEIFPKAVSWENHRVNPIHCLDLKDQCPPLLDAQYLQKYWFIYFAWILLLFIFSGKKVNPACYSILAQSITLFSNTRLICPLSHWTLSSLKIGLCFIHLHIFTHNLQRFMECHRCWLPLPLLWLQYGVARVMHRTLIASQGWKKLQALCFIYDTWSLLIHP